MNREALSKLEPDKLNKLLAIMEGLADLAGLSDSNSTGARSTNHPPEQSHDDSVTVAQAVNELMIAKIRAGRGEQYVRQLRHCFDEFGRGRLKRPLASITASEIEEWLSDSKLSPRTIKGRIQYLRLLFGFGMRRSYCSKNPASAIDFPTQSSDEPGIHTPEQVRLVLEAARAWSPRLTRVLAIRYFAGIRAAEVARLEERDIGEKYIVVPAAKAKTRQRRLVTIQPALRAWLDLGGELPGQTCEQQIWELTRKLGIEWPRNCTRHSWASYHLAHFGRAATTAMEAGHSEAMLYAHYRALVTPEEAERFWAIRPASKAELAELLPIPAPIQIAA